MKKNSLDGKTVVRFTLSFMQGGGIEEYLASLNTILLERNSMTIIQMSLQKEGQKTRETVQEVGKGCLVRVLVPAVFDSRKNWNAFNGKGASEQLWIRRFTRDHLVYKPILCSTIFKKIREKRKIANLGIDAKDGAKIYDGLIKRFAPDLLLFHSLGSEQTALMADISSQKDVPYVYVNHYANSKFTHFCIREQIANACAVAGVSSNQVPRYVRRRFFNLLDGIDVNFFRCSQITDLETLVGSRQIVLLPARVAPGKGHVDLIHAAARLKVQGVDCNLVFAGRKDSPQLAAYLKKLSQEKGVLNSVELVGHCSPEELREWYAKCSVVVLPSSTEGLGRVLLEAQAMSRPVVAYNVGGVSQCMQHNVSGYLCRRGDIRQLATYLETLLSDKGLRAQMGSKGKAFVRKKFTLSHLAIRHEEFYSGAIESKTGGAVEPFPRE